MCHIPVCYLTCTVTCVRSSTLSPPHHPSQPHRPTASGSRPSGPSYTPPRPSSFTAPRPAPRTDGPASAFAAAALRAALPSADGPQSTKTPSAPPSPAPPPLPSPSPPPPAAATPPNPGRQWGCAWGRHGVGRCPLQQRWGCTGGDAAGGGMLEGRAWLWRRWREERRREGGGGVDAVAGQ